MVDKNYILVKAAIIKTQYTNESVIERMRPHPDLCKFLSVSELASLAKEEALMELLQEAMVWLRANVKDKLAELTSHGKAKAFTMQCIESIL